MSQSGKETSTSKTSTTDYASPKQKLNEIADIKARLSQSEKDIAKEKPSEKKSQTKETERQIVININGIQYQNIEQLTNAIADTLQSLTMREAVGYGV